MPTATKTKHSLNDSSEQFTQLNEQFAQAGKRAGIAYLDGYEKFVEGAISFQQKLVEQAPNDVVKSAIETQVDTTRQLTSAYTTAARELLS